MPEFKTTTHSTTGSGPQTKLQTYTEDFSSLQWFRITSGTVHPEFELGDLVAVSPSQPVLDGDLALVGLNNSLLFARLYRLGDDRLFLSSGSSFRFAFIDEVAILSRVMARHRFYLRDGENPQYTVNAQPFGEEVR
ncbi:MAG: S24 family peptidase [Desulfobulbaceae bacterium]|nr:S24 family peptidase [Desulfobulbaceae bacterium]